VLSAASTGWYFPVRAPAAGSGGQISRWALPARRVAHALAVFAHEPNAEMTKRRLGNLPRSSGITLELYAVYGRHLDRVGGHSFCFDNHARREMDDAAKLAVFLDVEVVARIIATHPLSGFQPARQRLDAAIGAEKPIPAIINYREIAVGMAVMDKVEVLFSPEPGEAAEPRPGNMIVSINIYVSAE
jgi:hypothetical protein